MVDSIITASIIPYLHGFNDQTSHYLLDTRTWQKRGRQVMKGERAIRILAPMVKKIKENNGDETYIIRGFRPVSVFDVSQTEGDEIEELGCPELVSGNFDFETIVKACPVPILIRHLGVSNGKQMETQ